MCFLTGFSFLFLLIFLGQNKPAISSSVIPGHLSLQSSIYFCLEICIGKLAPTKAKAPNVFYNLEYKNDELFSEEIRNQSLCERK